MDGYQFGVHSDTQRPVFLFGRDDRSDDDSWQVNSPHYKGWKREISLEQSKHNTFGEDLALIFNLKKCNC